MNICEAFLRCRHGGVAERYRTSVVYNIFTGGSGAVNDRWQRRRWISRLRATFGKDYRPISAGTGVDAMAAPEVHPIYRCDGVARLLAHQAVIISLCDGPVRTYLTKGDSVMRVTNFELAIDAGVLPFSLGVYVSDRLVISIL